MLVALANKRKIEKLESMNVPVYMPAKGCQVLRVPHASGPSVAWKKGLLKEGFLEQLWKLLMTNETICHSWLVGK